AEHPQDPRREQEPAVPVQAAEAGDQARVDRAVRPGRGVRGGHRGSLRARMPAMAKTQTSHEPTPDELAHGTGEVHHPGDLAGEAHGPDDTARWGAFLVGIGAGLIVGLCLVITTTLLTTSPLI